MRLAIYAHYSNSPQVARHVLFYLEQLAALGFQICLVSNSEISPASEAALQKLCDRIMVRENTGLDFAMWQRGLAEYDWAQFEELLLTNSSIIGPLQPLAPLWQNPAIAACDFWGLTDNLRFAPHLQSYFLVFRRPVIQSQCFRDFWRAVLPYKSKVQIVMNYEVGLTRWLEEGGFKWRAILPQDQVWPLVLKQRRRVRKIYHWLRQRPLPPEDTTLFAYQILLQLKMPFLKTSLLRENQWQIPPQAAYESLKEFNLPADIMAELQMNILAESKIAKLPPHRHG